MTLATKLRFGVVIFPGSNCDTDAWHALHDQMGAPVEYIWHQETDLSGFDCVILPGGFSYGDYLRTGAIARFSPVMNAVTDFAGKGGLVIGICNGFQILLEAGLLPGAMMRNVGQTFVCKYVNIRVESANTPYTRTMQEGAGLRLRSASPHPERPSGPRPGPSGSQRGSRGAVLRMPIAHGEGSYYADESTLAALKRHDQIIFRYCTPEGEITKAANPNGSLRSIAGICNRGRNVMGMMPHPERCSDPLLGSSDGRLVWESLING